MSQTPDYFRREVKLRETLRTWDPLGLAAADRTEDYEEWMERSSDVLHAAAASNDLSYLQDCFRFWVRERGLHYDRKAAQPFLRDLLDYWRASRLMRVDEGHDLLSDIVRQSLDLLPPKLGRRRFVFAGDLASWDRWYAPHRVVEEGGLLTENADFRTDYLVSNEPGASAASRDAPQAKLLSPLELCDLFRPTGAEAKRLLTGGPAGIARWNRLANVWGDLDALPREAFVAPKPLDLSGIELSSAALAGVRLMHVILSGANFSGADGREARICAKEACFEKALLEKASIYQFERCQAAGADLTGASFSQANLAGSDLSRAKLCGASVRGSAVATRFVEADLRTARLEGVFDGADFSGADLSDVIFAGQLRRASFQGAKLVRVIAVRCDLAEADLRQADLQQANLCDSDLSGANAEGANWAQANLTGAVGADVFVTIAPPATRDVRGEDVERWYEIGIAARKLSAKVVLTLPSGRVRLTLGFDFAPWLRRHNVGVSWGELKPDGTYQPGRGGQFVSSAETPRQQLLDALEHVASRFAGGVIDPQSVEATQTKALVKGRELKAAARDLWHAVYGGT
jgi:uncharacterized protein YjbI with pentapeptide repeats